MPKRTIEDTEFNSGDNDIKISSKKSRKEKKDKKEKKSKDVEEPATESTPIEVEVESKEARRERKRLKKEKKAQEAEKETEEEEKSGVDAIEPASDANAAADAKAAKKAEKARLKALKKEEKEEKADSTKSIETAAPASVTPQQNGTTYTEDPNLSGLPQSEIDSFLTTNFITITDPLSTSATLRPLTNFDYLPITDPAQRAPFKDFKAPTPIQAAAWPFLLAGRDVIGVAETGSGKTMAFAVPCVRYMSALPKNQINKGPRAVVVSPTRELAMQSYEQIVKLAKASGLLCVCVYGGVPKDEQIRALKTADIVVATPGRLNDLINQGCADLSKARYVVLDEADRMLDKGFEEEIRKIINTTPSLGKRQTLMFTATWPESVRELAATFMTSPVKIAIGDNPTGDLRANSRIVQKVEVVEPRDKEYRLMQLLKQYQSGSQKDDRILVFCLYKKEATRVESFIRQKGFRVAGIHGDLSQEQRTRSLEAFKSGNTPILVATDVAARGLDIPAVKLVINCTFPLTVEDYVHRIGRTGRAGKDGLAITLFTEHDKAQSGALINVLKAANQPVPDELLKFGTTVKKKAHDAYGAFFKNVDTTKKATKITFD
ncbi:putative atp-dependent rna helicase dbp3 protein [Botrytis fragariae]|uniref:RNA helicase n=1 Tax=Botrytis fragariae TaxID=1964551 RepID=A0A8H6AL23_9HELO|nr:putative atp-dependent rna helicase dbp3 protein [Botrytis fragariae]KAF5869379.1 putative atp-dependent rna helicase dbp3 protein [Botrytis fragariae]